MTRRLTLTGAVLLASITASVIGCLIFIPKLVARFW